MLWSQEGSRAPVVAFVQLLSRVRLFVTPWTAAHQASMSFTISQCLLKLMSIELVMPSNYFIHCPSSSAFNLSQHQGFLQWVGYSHQVAKVLELYLQHQSFHWVFRVDFLWDWLTWSPCCPRDSIIVLICIFLKINNMKNILPYAWASLVAQWWRIHLPMQ